MRKFRRFWAALAVLLCLPSVLQAESPYRAAIVVDGLELAQASKPSHATVHREQISPVHLSAVIHGQGLVRASFNIRRNKTWKAYIQGASGPVEDLTNPLLLQGRIKIGHGSSQPAAAAVIGNMLQVNFAGRQSSYGQRIYQLRAKIVNGKVGVAHISAVPRSSLQGKGCAAHLDHDLSNASVSPADSSSTADHLVQALSLKAARVATDTDPQFYAIHGNNSNAVIAAIINATDAIYQRDLGVTLEIGTQHVYTSSSPYSSTDPGTVLTEFRNNPANDSNLGSDSDVRHLFSGRDFDGSVVGIAYVGAVCTSYGYGADQYYSNSTITTAIFAHELGHNFGAPHDTTDSASLMYPSLSNFSNMYFSPASISSILNYLNSSGSCLEDVSGGGGGTTPTPTPTAAPTAAPPPEALTISIASSRVAGKRNVFNISGYVTQSSVVVSDQRVKLVYNGRSVGSTYSDGSGNYIFRLTVTHFTTAVKVRVSGGGAVSRTITLRPPRTTRRSR